MRLSVWIRRIGAGVGLAGTMLALLLWLCAAAATEAAETTPDVIQPAPAAQIAPAWGSTEPVTILFTSTQTIRWDLAPYNAAITLPQDIVSSGSFRPSAIFTFTPQSSRVFSAPLTALDQFFYLDGEFVLDGMQEIPPDIEAQAIAFNPQALPQIEWQYQDAELLGVQESSVQLYVYWKLFGLETWDAQLGTVYSDSNQAVFRMSRVGLYGFGGYKGRLYLPLALKNK